MPATIFLDCASSSANLSFISCDTHSVVQGRANSSDGGFYFDLIAQGGSQRQFHIVDLPLTFRDQVQRKSIRACPLLTLPSVTSQLVRCSAKVRLFACHCNARPNRGKLRVTPLEPYSSYVKGNPVLVTQSNLASSAR